MQSASISIPQARGSRWAIAAAGIAALLSAALAHRLSGVSTGMLATGAGPLASLGFGLLALCALYLWRNPPARLFLALAASCNLFLFACQLAWSAAAGTGVWAWPMHQAGVGALAPWCVLAPGMLVYWGATRTLVRQLGPFLAVVRRGEWSLWVVCVLVGALACLFGWHPGLALLHHVARHATPQPLLVSTGLLLAPFAWRD